MKLAHISNDESRIDWELSYNDLEGANESAKAIEAT